MKTALPGRAYSSGCVVVYSAVTKYPSSRYFAVAPLEALEPGTLFETKAPAAQPTAPTTAAAHAGWHWQKHDEQLLVDLAGWSILRCLMWSSLRQRAQGGQRYEGVFHKLLAQCQVAVQQA